MNSPRQEIFKEDQKIDIFGNKRSSVQPAILDKIILPVEKPKLSQKRKSTKIDVYQALMNHDIKQFESEKEHKISKKKQEQQMWA